MPRPRWPSNTRTAAFSWRSPPSRTVRKNDNKTRDRPDERFGRVVFSPGLVRARNPRAPIIVKLTHPPPLFRRSFLPLSLSRSPCIHPPSPPSLPRPSLPPRKAGLGIFTGIDLREGDGIAESDIVVPFHEDYGIFDFDFLWRRYSWEPSELGMHFDMQDGLALVLGTGCVPNCDFALLNAREGTVSPVRPSHRGWVRKKRQNPPFRSLAPSDSGFRLVNERGKKK